MIMQLLHFDKPRYIARRMFHLVGIDDTGHVVRSMLSAHHVERRAAVCSSMGTTPALGEHMKQKGRFAVCSAALCCIAVMMALAVLSLLRGGVTVVLRNIGAEPLRSVVVHVTGNAYPIGDMHPGTIRTLQVVATGESHIELEHTGNDRLVIGCYFEDGYVGSITADITPTQVVNVRDAIRMGPFEAAVHSMEGLCAQARPPLVSMQRMARRLLGSEHDVESTTY